MFDKVRKLFKRNNEVIPLPEGYDSEIFTQVMERAITPEQQTGVLRTAYHLTRLWNGGDTAQIPRVITMVEANYPHLERMAAHEIFSQEWLDELKTVLLTTADSAEVLVYLPKDFRQLLLDTLNNLEPD